MIAIRHNKMQRPLFDFMLFSTWPSFDTSAGNRLYMGFKVHAQQTNQISLQLGLFQSKRNFVMFGPSIGSYSLVKIHYQGRELGKE